MPKTVACPSKRKIEPYTLAAKQNAGVVDEIARGEIVGAINDDVEVLEQFQRVGAGKLRFERLDLNVRIEVRESRARGFALGLADVTGAKRDLALEVGEVHHVKVNEAEFADARGGKIQAQRARRARPCR